MPQTNEDTLTKVKRFQYFQKRICLIMCHYSTINWCYIPHRLRAQQTLRLFPRQAFCFFPTMFSLAETLLSCFLPFLAFKISIALLICVGHNSGKQACFLLHHFLRINTSQQWPLFKKKRGHASCVLMQLCRLHNSLCYSGTLL